MTPSPLKRWALGVRRWAFALVFLTAVLCPLTSRIAHAQFSVPGGGLTNTQLRATPVPISGSIRLTDGTLSLTLLNSAPVSDTGQVAVPVRIISSLAAGGGGGSTVQYAEDTAAADAEQLVMTGVVRKDTRGTLVNADGDRTELQVNANGDVRIDGSAVIQPVSIASQPLPTGAATELTLASILTTVNNIKAKTDNLDVLLSTRTKPADSQTVSGPVTDTQLRATAVPVSASALTDGTQKAIARGGAKGATTAADLTSTAQGADHQSLDVQNYVSGAAIDPRIIRALTSADVVSAVQSGVWTVQPGNTANTTAWKVDGSAVTQPISAAALPLPSGGATSANQTTGNTSVGNIDAKTPALGQAAMAASRPVVIASNQSAVPVSQSAATVPAATTMQNAATANGNGTNLNVQGYANAIINVVSSPAMSGGTTINFEASVDDTTWVPILAHQVGAPGALANTSIIDGDYRVNGSGYKSLRARISAYSAGTVTIKGYVSPLSAQPTTVGLAAGTSAIGTVTAPAVTKGTQGANGFTTQDLKDAGRSQIMLAWEEMTGTAAAESALTNFTLGSKAGAALSAASSYTVTTGKTLRIQSVTVYTKTTSTVNNLARFRIRTAASAIANSSPVIFDQVLALQQNGTYLAGEIISQTYSIPDGLEVPATWQVTFTWFTAANTCTTGVTIIGYEY